MRRSFKLLSIAVHAIVIAGLSLAEVADVGPLPTPHTALAFEAPRVRIADVPLPPAPRRAASDASVSPNLAPIVEPRGVTPETGRETAPPPPTGMVEGVENGGRGAVSFDHVPGGGVPPPPPPAPPPTPVRLHAGIQPPRKIVDVAPVYPKLAQAARREGIVVLEAVIDAGGGVESVRVLRGYPLLDQAAVDAVRQWRFTAALLNGAPVPVVMTVTVNFSLK